MTTKLVSINIGCKLIVEVDGVQKEVDWSAAGAKQPREILRQLHAFLLKQIGMDYIRETVPLAKPKRIKARRPVSQTMYNKKLKELGYRD